MSDKINDGGPAFPTHQTDDQRGYGGCVSFIPVGGMTLRDYFAAKAMQAMVTGHRKHNRDPRRRGVDEPLLDYTSPDCESVIEDTDCNAQIIAQTAYEVADAMLKAREAK